MGVASKESQVEERRPRGAVVLKHQGEAHTGSPVRLLLADNGCGCSPSQSGWGRGADKGANWVWAGQALVWPGEELCRGPERRLHAGQAAKQTQTLEPGPSRLPPDTGHGHCGQMAQFSTPSLIPIVCDPASELALLCLSPHPCPMLRGLSEQLCQGGWNRGVQMSGVPGSCQTSQR